jgi:hypothetical protein
MNETDKHEFLSIAIFVLIIESVIILWCLFGSDAPEDISLKVIYFLILNSMPAPFIYALIKLWTGKFKF